MNSCNLTGRITADIELKTTQNGISVCSFGLAVKRPRVKDTTDFINIRAFRQTAEYLSKYARKGTQIEVSGTLTSQKWEDKNGNNRTTYEVIVNEASILESKKDNPTETSGFSNADVDDFEDISGVDGVDLPF